MSVLQTYLFDNAADYLLSNTTINVDRAVLTLTDKAAVPFQELFSVDTGFTYNAALAEFTAGQVQQKDQTPTNSLMAADFNATANPFNLRWNKDGGVTASLNGTPVITAGKLVCVGAQGVFWAGNTSLTETHKFKYTPNYTTSPPTNVNIFANKNSLNNNDRFVLTHSPSGNTLRVTMENNVGASVISTATVIGAAWTPTAGVEYEFEVVINATAGTVRVFLDGVLHGTLTPTTWARGGVAVDYQIGATPGLYNTAQGSFDDYIKFSDAQHTASYTPGYSIAPFIYAESLVTLPSFSYTGIGALQSLDSGSTSETGAPRYVFNGEYWTGVAWAASDGSYVQANSFSASSPNFASLDIEGATSLPCYVVFGNSNTQSSVSQIDLSVTGQKYNALGYLEPTTAVDVKSFDSYSHESTETGDSYIRVVLRINNVLMWHDGITWTVSDGSEAQANTEAQVLANVSTLILGSNSTVFVRWLLIANTEIETPELISSDISYTFGAIEVGLALCLVYGYIKDISDQPIDGVTVTFTLDKPDNSYREGNSNVIEKPVNVVTDANGYFSQSLVRSSEFVEATQYRVTFVKSADGVNITTTSDGNELLLTVPDLDMQDITGLL